MSIKQFKPYTPGRRQMSIQGREDITADKPERSLTTELRKSGGRNNTGRITMRHIGGGHRRTYRIIDFRRNKIGVPGKVATIEYDPNRNAAMLMQIMMLVQMTVVYNTAVHFDGRSAARSAFTRSERGFTPGGSGL